LQFAWRFGGCDGGGIRLFLGHLFCLSVVDRSR
jgi:hypothetical protein